jgi:hypothetical protein
MPVAGGGLVVHRDAGGEFQVGSGQSRTTGLETSHFRLDILSETPHGVTTNGALDVAARRRDNVGKDLVPMIRRTIDE